MRLTPRRGFHFSRIVKYENAFDRLLILAISIYFPIYSISIISGIQLHQVLAIFSSVLATIIFCNSRKNLFLLLLILAFLAIKFTLTNDFQIRFITVGLIGWLLLIAIIQSSSKLANTAFIKNIKLLLWTELIIVSLITTLQYLGAIPISIGNLTFVNSVVAGFSEEALGFSRPNGYFYHPYDLAIFLSPFFFYICINRIKYGLIASILITFFVYLKSLMLWLLLALFSKAIPKFIFKKPWFVVCITMLLAFSITALTLVFADRNFTAGRIYLWDLYIFDYFQADLTSIFFGLNKQEVTVSQFMPDGDLPMPHNQFLFFILYGGIVFILLYGYLFKLTIVKLKNHLNTDISVYILICFLSLGLTGDLSVMLPFWIAACIAVIISVDTIFKRNAQPARYRHRNALRTTHP